MAFIILSVVAVLLIISVKSKCGSKGVSCCEACTSADATVYCRYYCTDHQGTCIQHENPLYGPYTCCPNKGDTCCDEYGESNCCNPTAPYCVQGKCTDAITDFSDINTCDTDNDCCASTPYCFDSILSMKKKCTVCGGVTCPKGIGCPDPTNGCTECCAEYPYCWNNRCVDTFISPGRAYNLLNTEYTDLRADIVNNCDMDMDEEYINNLLAEHASIGTFNKFSIELMNLGAPLWFVQLSQNAALDEINHTKIMLNILNGNSTNNNCIQIGKFPNHQIVFNDDCNGISLDVVNGGCFGETLSALNTMSESIKFEQLYSVAMDEVRHSAFAWIAAKWMINNCQNIDISKQKWWENKLKQSQLTVITKMFNAFWNFKGNDYKNLYKIIHDILYKELSSIHQKLKN